MTAMRGYVLLPVVVTIAVIAVIAFLISRESTLEVNRTASEFEAARADYVAQAGLQHALRETPQQGCGPYSDLTGVAFGSDQYSTVLTTDLGATTSYTITVDQDSWIANDTPANNYANDMKLVIRYGAGVIARPLYRYDLSSIAPNAIILSATAWFHVSQSHPQGAVDIHRITADWTETDATWDSLGANLESAVLASIPAQTASQSWVSVNLTGQVQAWVNGQPNFGITLNATSAGVLGDYDSRESAFVPYLEVVVGAPPSSPATLSATATTAKGLQRTITRNTIGLQQKPDAHLFLQPDAAQGKDTFLYEWKSTWNYGVDSSIWVEDQFVDSTAHGLIRFDVGMIPAGARIVDATLDLYQANNSLWGGPIGVYRVSSAWDEGTRSGGIGNPNWTERNDINSWLTNGGDFDSRRYALATVPVGQGWTSWDISDLVQHWASGRFANEGLLLRAETFGSAAHFASSDDTDPTLRPKLSVTYTCNCGEICFAPQGSGNILMVVLNPTTLVAEDQKAKDLFESWGYTVNVISESANQTAFDAGFAANDVVFISETVNAQQVGDKTVGASIGVVSQDGAYNPDLGIASGSARPVAASINVSDSSHYITQPFAVGSLDIYSHSMEQLTVAGTQAAGLQTLADSAAAGSLVVLDAGAVAGGDIADQPAAGRRVMLPLGTRYRFDWDRLNANGRLLVQRAIAWAMSADVTATPLLMVSAGATMVTFPSGDMIVLPTAQEQLRIDLLEPWGYQVNLISENDTDANFDAALAANDVAYIPPDVNPSAVQFKLTGATIGVVNEEGEMVDELGIANGPLYKSRREVDIVDNTHYITEPFTTGLLAFAAVDQPVHMLSGGVAPGLATLAQSFNTGSLWVPSLATIETGGALSGGGNAAGRRVQLPWGGAAFDFAQLTADGKTLLQRALEWAAQPNATVKPPIAHWKLDEASGFIAIDSAGGNDATLNGNPSWTTGRIDGALDFDGNGDYATTDSNFTPPPVGTVTFWLQVPGVPTSRSRVFGMADDWEIRHEAGGSPDAPASSLVFDLGDGDTNEGFWTTIAIDQADRWYHIAAAYDTNTEAYAVYVDGILNNSGTYPTDLAVPAPALLSIGTRTGSEEHFEGSLDDVRVYDRALSANEIANLYAEAPIILAYEETYQSWTAINDNVWEVVDLAAFGVPPNVVVEVAVINIDSVRERSGGVRAVGSALDRRLILHEAESGGSDVMIMHVQANAASQIEHYVESNTKVSFILLGYWSSGSFVESWNVFSANNDLSWDNVALSDYAVPAGAVAEVLMHNDNNDAQFRGGVRTPGSAAQRLINLHEAESGGNEIATMLVTAGSDASATIEVYSESVGDVDFYLSGYWDNPPGVFTETFSEIAGLPSSSSSWEDAGLAAFGVPADAVVSIMLVNSQDSAEAQLGVRRKGSILARNLELQEAEPTGDDLGSMHALTDGSSIIQLYDQNTTQNHRFYLMGWWETSP